MQKRCYLDNAATSFPKPQSVLQAMTHYTQYIGASAGRGAYREAIESGDVIHQARCSVAKLINASDPLSIIMTFNCTDGLTQAIKGLLTEPKIHIITTRMEHNSVLRPLSSLQKQIGLDVTYVPADSYGMIDPDDIRKAIRPNTRLIASVHGSNVCGSVQDVTAIGQIAHDHEIPFLVDAAQTAGHLPLDVQAMHVDMMAFPGHKGLLGPLGTGVLYIRPGFENRLVTIREGGTGSRSEIPEQPRLMPDRFESGSHNALGISGLHAGVEFVLEKGVDTIASHDRLLCETFLKNVDNAPKIKVFGPTNLDQRIGVFSVRIEPYEPADLAAILEDQFGILSRPGLHCAPYAHQAIGTLDKGGTTRLSTGIFTTQDDILFAANALTQIANG